MPSSHRSFIPAVSAAVVSLTVAACGAAPQPTSTRPSGLIAYSHCMRTHGVPAFPDPTSSQGITKRAVVAVSGTPQFATASTDCRRFLPATGLAAPPTAQQIRTRVADAIAFARCMRAHGFAHFPDPTATGDLTHQMLASAGIELHQPAVVQAADGCTGVTHGLITPASVASFIAGH